jgi:cell division cycle 20-like protein 1 (cofactor of APC complex)
MRFIRFIPNREGQDLQASFSLLHDDASPTTPSRVKKRTPHGELHFQKSKSHGRIEYQPSKLLTPASRGGQPDLLDSASFGTL